MSQIETAAESKSELSSLTMETEWIDIDDGDAQGSAGEAADGLNERIVATVTTIEQEEGLSTYSFRGVIRYGVEPGGRGLEVVEYSGTGVLLEGVDRGSITYRSRGRWRGVVDDGRQFEAAGAVDWSDDFNAERQLEVTFRGVLLDGDQIGYLTTSISGLAVLGRASPARLLMDVPALL